MDKKIIITFLIVIILAAASVFVLYPRKDIVTQVNSLLVKMNKGDIVRQSNLIVLGVVQDIQSKKLSSQIRKGEEDIVSDVRVLVERYIKNDLGLNQPEIIIRILGGMVGGERMEVEDAPSFSLGDKVLVFLHQEESGVFTTIGWAQGKYTLSADGTVGIGNEKNILENIFGKKDFIIDDLIKEIENVK